MTDNVVRIPESAHSSRGASGAYRYLACARSIKLTEQLAKEGKKVHKTSPAAAEGTVAHTVASTALEEGSEAWEFAGMEFKAGDWSFVVDEEMQSGVQTYLDLVRDLIKKYRDAGHEVRAYIEKKLDSITHDDAWGSPDVIIHVVGLKLIIIDFKYGRGVPVSTDSPQIKYYGYLACENYLPTFNAVKEVEMWISQPRIPHSKGVNRADVMTPQALEEWWMTVLLPGIEETYNPEATLVVGEHCRFCPAKDFCPALKKEVFDFNLEIEPDYLTEDEIGKIMDKKSAISKYFERIEQEAFRRAMRGSPIPGYKLVRQKANRVFKDSIAEPNPEDSKNPKVIKLEDAVKTRFGDAAYTEPVLKTPPQIEKLSGGKSFVAQWAYSPVKGLTLAANSDTREAVKRTIEQYMDEIDERAEGDPDAPY